MRITIICEGKTEKAFKECLIGFLRTRLAGRMPSLRFDVHHRSIPSGDKLQRVVSKLLNTGVNRSDAVIGLTDVYPEFSDATDAKTKMRAWVGNEPAFYPHAAQFDFEAWLLPYWDRILELARRKSKPFGAQPERVNGNNPPGTSAGKAFRSGQVPRQL